MRNKQLNRSEVRGKALQSLFPMNINVELTIEEAIENAMLLDSKASIEEIPEYLEVLVTGVLEHMNEIDEMIQKRLSRNWQLTRISKLDLTILRVAIFEMHFSQGNVPAVVAVDEAIELAKKYSDLQGVKFVNGVLSNILKELGEA